MRLTFRRLLAYLDGVLDEQDVEVVGQKIAESNIATTLIQRIQNAKTRDRLGAPRLDGTGMGLDPNTVAEYLDYTLEEERVPEFEKVCFESDQHLAEVSASHEILTLVLAEPAQVERSIRERMYSIPREVSDGRVPRDEEKPTRRVDSVEAELPQQSQQEATAMREMSELLEERNEVRWRSLLLTTALSFLLVLVGLRAIGKFDQSHPLLGPLLASSDSPEDASNTNPLTPTGPAVVADDANAADAANAANDATQAGSPAVGTSAVKDAEGTPPVSPKTSDAAEPSAPIAPLPLTPPTDPPADPPQPGEAPGAAPPLGDNPAGPPPLIPPAAPQPLENVPDSNEGEPAGPTIQPAEPTEPDVPLAEPGVPPSEPPTSEPPTSEPPTSEPPSSEPPSSEPSPAPSPAPAPSTVVDMGLFNTPDQVMARYDAAQNLWLRLDGSQVIQQGDRLWVPPYYQPQITLKANVQLTVIGPAEVEMVGMQQNKPSIRLHYGRIKLETVATANREIQLDLQGVEGEFLLKSADCAVAVQANSYVPMGKSPASSAVRAVRWIVLRGEGLWTAKDKTTGVPVLQEQAMTEIGGAVSKPVLLKTLPPWTAARQKTHALSVAANDAEREFSTDRAISLTLEELLHYRTADVRSMAVQSLCYLRNYVPFIQSLRGEKRGDLYHSMEFQAMRDSLGLADADQKLLDALSREFEGQPDVAQRFAELCRGFDNTQLKAGQDARLIEDLKHAEVAIRILAVENLRAITRKDKAYNPQKDPASQLKGVAAWAKLLESGDVQWKAAPSPFPSN